MRDKTLERMQCINRTILFGSLTGVLFAVGLEIFGSLAVIVTGVSLYEFYTLLQKEEVKI